MSDWRALVDEALKGEDIRDSRDRTHPNDPIDPSAPSADPTRQFRDWQQAIRALDPVIPARGYSVSRWHRLHDTSDWWLKHFGKRAALDGWTTADVFGVHAEREGWGGLIDRLGNARGLVMDCNRAKWRCIHGIPDQFNRGAYPDLRPFWEAAPPDPLK